MSLKYTTSIQSEHIITAWMSMNMMFRYEAGTFISPSVGVYTTAEFQNSWDIPVSTGINHLYDTSVCHV